MSDNDISRIVRCMNQIAGNGVFTYDPTTDCINEIDAPLIPFVSVNFDDYWKTAHEYIMCDMDIRRALDRYNPDWMIVLGDDMFYGAL